MLSKWSLNGLEKAGISRIRFRRHRRSQKRPDPLLQRARQSLCAGKSCRGCPSRTRHRHCPDSLGHPWQTQQNRMPIPTSTPNNLWRSSTMGSSKTTRPCAICLKKKASNSSRTRILKSLPTSSAHFTRVYFLKAVQQAVPLLKGAFAFAVIHRDFPDQIIACAHEAPLVIGIGAQEAFVSSDTHAFAAHTREVVFLANAEIAVVKADHLEIYDSSMSRSTRRRNSWPCMPADVIKGKFEHYTLKEIHEQPQTIRSALLSRFLDEYGTAVFEELHFSMNELLAVERIMILACGTSWHAGCVASYLLEDKARIPVQVEISSEFRYKNPVVPPRTLAIAISQSGETADTLAALRELKAKGSKILAICNVYGSYIGS